MKLLSNIGEGVCSGAGIMLGVIVVDLLLWEGKLKELLEIMIEALRAVQ